MYTQTLASEAVARMVLQDRVSYDSIHSYACEHCGTYHVGHAPSIKSKTIPYNRAIVYAYTAALECINEWLAG